MHNTAVIPISGYVPPAVLINIASRELQIAHGPQSSWAPDVESEAHTALGQRYFSEAARQYWAMRGRP